MGRVALLVAGLGLLGGVAACEVLVGIKGKTEAETTDASSADGDASVEDPSAPCSHQPPYLFCDDFDQDSELEAGSTWAWDTPGAGSIELDTMQYKTFPKSVKVSVPNASTQAQLGQPVGALSTGFRLAFDLYVDLPDLSSIPQVGVAQVYRNGGTGTLTVNYVLGPGNQCSAQIYDTPSGAPAVTIELPPPVLQTWTRIVLVYDAVQGVTVIEDTKTIGTSSAAAFGAPGDTGIIVGAVFTNPMGSGPFVINLDDVVMRGQ